MPVDYTVFAQECVQQGIRFGVNPHYMVAVAQLRSGISDDRQDDQVGPFRLKQADWDAHREDKDFEVHFWAGDIGNWRAQCVVFGLMVYRAFTAFVSEKNRNPGALEIYLQQWPDIPAATIEHDLQSALDRTADIVRTAADAVLDDPSSASPTIAGVRVPIALQRMPGKKRPSATATELLNKETSTPGPIPTAVLRDVFVIAGRLGPLRRRASQSLSTSLLLFAAIDQGRRNITFGEQWQFLTAFAAILQEMAGEGYEKVRQQYFREQLPPLDEGIKGPHPTFSRLSTNTRTLIKKAREVSDSGAIAVDVFLINLLDLDKSNAVQNLRKMGIDVKVFRARLASWRYEEKPVAVEPAADPSATVTSVEVPAAEQSEIPAAVETPRTYVSPFNNDDPRSAAIDLLNIEDEVVAFARLAASANVPPPLSIGVFGDWGSGKTYFMDRMHAEVERIASEPGHRCSQAFYTNIVQIRFNAWHYIETNLWASLVEYIFNELDRWLRARNVERPQVDALFDQLATSRQLKLDAYRDLLSARREGKAASDALDKARKEHEGALKRSVVAPATNTWPKVVNAFAAAITDADKNKLQRAADDLGVPELKTSYKDLAALVHETRVQATRARVVGNALIARFGSAKDAVMAGVVVLAAPLLMSTLIALIASASGWIWMRQLQTGIIEFVSFISAAIALAGIWIERARKGLNALDALRSALDHEAANVAEQERKQVAEAEVAAKRAQQAITEAQQRVTAARDRAITAKNNYDAETARGRLNRFIRSKVTGDSYGKHLGIIASIRKDFGQLTAMMMPRSMQEGDPQKALLEEELEEAKVVYNKRVKALIEEAQVNSPDGSETSLLYGDEVRDLREESDQRLPSFDRIILYIDDLDRCPPQKVVEVLQAIHMLLYFPLFVVVVAVDARWVSRALKAHYPDLISDERIADPGHLGPDPDRRPADAQDYLEKIFQLPYWVRRLDDKASINFVQGLAEPLVDIRDDGPKEVADDEPELKRPTAAAEVTSEPAAESHDISDLDDDEIIPRSEDQSVDDEPPPSVQRPSPERATRTSEFAQMKLLYAEKRILAEFAPFVGDSPRRAKRYVNLYLLLKTSLHLTSGLSSIDSRIAQRAIIALLAIVTGIDHPGAFFRELDRVSSAGPQNLVELLNELGGSGPKDRPFEAAHVIRKLIEVNKRDGVDDEIAMLNALRRFGPTVRRYSF